MTTTITEFWDDGMERIAENLHQAWAGQAWVSLGYRDWTDYCLNEFERILTVASDMDSARQAAWELVIMPWLTKRRTR